MELRRRQAVESAVQDAGQSLKDVQRADGHWVFEFEADATIPAEYIFMRHFLGNIDEPGYAELEAKLAVYLRKIQGDHGGWPLFKDGDFNISASVKAYWALKLVGDDIEAPHMRRAREAILAHGGAQTSNVFTRIAMALFGMIPWRAVPFMPVEIMIFPYWFPFHLEKVSYWSRTVIVPLLILMHLQPVGRNPRGVRIDELFPDHPDALHYKMNATGTALGALFAGLDAVVRRVFPLLPKRWKDRSLKEAVDFVTPRLNGEDGLGGIFPAMAGVVMAFDALGYKRDHPDFVTAYNAVEKLLKDHGDYAYCQPCLSPIWDTCLASHALLEAGEDPLDSSLTRAFDWLLEREITDTKGDWTWRRPDLAPSGWAFQYWNNYYPDVDDTAVVVTALHRANDVRYKPAIERAAAWVVGMQSRNGGWGSFDADNTHHYLNYIPFADHGALLDPPTVDVSARCLAMLAQLDYGRDEPVVAKAIAYLKREQEADGSWYGRWGTNYIYGTWSALAALNAVGEDMQQPYLQKAVAFLKDFQQADGGWGEDGATYWKERRGEVKDSTPSQTAWALLGLMAAGEVDAPEVARGVDYLLNAPRTGAKWDEELFTGVGFPRVFYLRYDGYSAYFPLWALARYRSLKQGNSKQPVWGL
ncbi:MAG: squalene--hopene cyclase [Pseudomonadota bacterium]